MTVWVPCGRVVDGGESGVCDPLVSSEMDSYCNRIEEVDSDEEDGEEEDDEVLPIPPTTG